MDSAIDAGQMGYLWTLPDPSASIEIEVSVDPGEIRTPRHNVESRFRCQMPGCTNGRSDYYANVQRHYRDRHQDVALGSQFYPNRGDKEKFLNEQSPDFLASLIPAETEEIGWMEGIENVTKLNDSVSSLDLNINPSQVNEMAGLPEDFIKDEELFPNDKPVAAELASYQCREVAEYCSNSEEAAEMLYQQLMKLNEKAEAIESEADSRVEVESDSESEAVGSGVVEPVCESDSESEGVSREEVEPNSESKASPREIVESDSEFELVFEPDSASKAGTGADSRVVVEPDSESEADSRVEVESDSESEAVGSGVVEPVCESDSESEGDAGTTLTSAEKIGIELGRNRGVPGHLRQMVKTTFPGTFVLPSLML